LSLLLLVNTIYSQSNFNTQYSDPKEVVITGTIKNFEKYPDIDVVNLYVEDVGLATNQIYYGRIDSLGNFKIKFSLYFPQDVGIEFRSWVTLLAHPGDSINVEFDADIENHVDLYNTIKFSGDAAKSNTQLATYLKEYWQNYISEDEFFRTHEKLQTNAFKEFRDSIKFAEKIRRDKFITEISPEKEVVRWTFYNIEADYMNQLLVHTIYYKEYNKLKSSDIKIDSSYFSFVDSLNIVDENALINTSISRQLIDYLLSMYFSPKVHLINSEKRYSILVSNIISFNKSDLLKQLLLSEIMNSKLKSFDMDTFDKFEPVINAYITAPYLIKPLNEHYKKAKEFLANPKIGSDAIIDSLTNGDAGEIFNAILEKHKGKVLFIDCWATWCSPCRGEMPYSKKLIEKFAGQNIEFIFLCIDSEYDKWKASLDEFQIGGTHYFLNPSESSALRKTLNISGIPHYVVINKEGIITKEGFEIRPSNPDAEEEIKKLMQ